MNNIGNKLKRLRQQKNLSLRALGKLANVSHSFIADIESGRSQPSLDTLQALAKALGISISDLVEDINNIDYNAHEKIETALGQNPDLQEFWKEYSQREDLQILFKQVKPLNPKSVRKIIEIIKLIEDEEAKED